MSEKELSVVRSRKDEMTDKPAESLERVGRRRIFVPRADIAEDAEKVTVSADMPGASEKTVELTVEKNSLSIRARVAETPSSGKKLVYGEYESGEYERTFLLSESVDRNGIEAKMKDGVLQVILPKARAARAMKIGVKAA